MLPDSGREGSTEQVQSLDVKCVERRHQIRWRKQIFHDDRFSFEPQSGMILVGQASLALGQDITFLFFVVLELSPFLGLRARRCAYKHIGSHHQGLHFSSGTGVTIKFMTLKVSEMNIVSPT